MNQNFGIIVEILTVFKISITFYKILQIRILIRNYVKLSCIRIFCKNFLINITFAYPGLYNNILMPEQSGVRAKHFTHHKLLCNVKFLTENLIAKKRVTAILLDITMAFDKVWHKRLLNKLGLIFHLDFYISYNLTLVIVLITSALITPYLHPNVSFQE